MRRPLIIGGFLTLGIVLVVLSFVFRSDRTSREDMVWARGQTPTDPSRQAYNRGPIGVRRELSGSPQSFTGMLVDATCQDRSRETLGNAPDTSMPAEPQTGSADRANGVDVSSSTVSRERSDAMQHQVPDLATRQSDAGCAVTGSTRGFALYLANGELKNLDEGGNTKVLAWFQSTPEGQRVLNGRARGAKPRVTIKGSASGDRIVVDTIE